MTLHKFSASNFCRISATWLVLLAGLHAQLPQQSTEAHQINGETVIEWFGYQGRTYFIQVSDDSDPLRKWIWAPVIEGGNDEAISYEFGGDAPLGFVRLQYTDEVPPPGVSLEEWDADGDGLSNLEEISGSEEQEASNPLELDTDGDGTPDGSDSDPNNAPDEPPIRGTWESRWIHGVMQQERVNTGQNLTVMNNTSGTDSASVDGSWMMGQQQFSDLFTAADHGAFATVASTYPLPEQHEEKLRGLDWRNIAETRAAWHPAPYREWSAGHLEHRLRLNKGAPPQGYEFPLQVLKLDWTRNAAEGSPWVAAGGSSIVKKFTFVKGETVSPWMGYDPIVSVAENNAVTLHAIRFEEVEPESGFDNHVRYLANQRFDLPWLMVANSATATTKPNAQVKLHFSPAEPALNLTVDVPGRTATVSPPSVSGAEPVVLTIEGDLGTTACEGTLKINGIPVLQLAFYPRKEVNLAVHEISLINDDIDRVYSYIDQQDLQTKQKSVAPGEGRPDATCITKGTNGILNTTPQGDDYAPGGGIIRTGKNGICETPVAGDDVPLIKVGEGEANAEIVLPGQNGELNTAPNEPGSNLLFKGRIVNPQDDMVVGTTVTTGPDGIRQTPSLKPRQDPVNVPSQEQFQQYLDRTYGKQANLWLKIRSWNKKDAAFDVASTLADDAAYPALQKPNHFFDFFTTQTKQVGGQEMQLETREEQIVAAASYDSSSELNLYFMGARLGSHSSDFPVSHPLGFARSRIRRPYVSAYNPISSSQMATFRLMGAAAHELGHNDLLGQNSRPGLHHPWSRVAKSDDPPPPEAENGMIPETEHFTLLDQQSDTRRLMWPTVAQEPDPTTGRYPSKLIKHEVDKLHELGP